MPSDTTGGGEENFDRFIRTDKTKDIGWFLETNKRCQILSVYANNVGNNFTKRD